MKPRSPNAGRAIVARLLAHQEDRLIRIARGRLKPGCARERRFLKEAWRTGEVRTADFMLSARAYVAEQRALGPDAHDPPTFF